GMHVDSLDAAARLARVEERAIDEVLDRMREIGIGPHIGRILTAQLEPDANEAAGRRLLDGTAGIDRSGEGDVIDTGVGDQPFHLGVTAMQRLKYPSRQSGSRERLCEAFGAQRGLCRVT